MLDPTARVLRLLSLLQTHRFWPGRELADELEVSDRTLRRDIDRLRDLGYSVEATPGVAGGYRLSAGAHLPPLVLDDDEAVAIAVGLRAAASASIDGIEDLSVRALAKLEQVLPDRLRRRVSSIHANVTPMRWNGGGSGPTVDAEVLAVLAQGCRDDEEARFEYEARDGQRTDRLVQPHQLVSAGRRWYLVAWDVRRDDWRTFRLDRMTEPRLAGARFRPRALPGGDAAAYVAESIRGMPRAHEGELVVEATAEEVRGAVRWLEADVDPVAGNPARARVRLRAEDLDRMAEMVAVLAVRFPVIEVVPPELAERLGTLVAHLPM